MANTNTSRGGANKSNTLANATLVANSLTKTTAEQISEKHAEATNEQGITLYTDETLCNLHAPSLGTYRAFTIRVDSKMKSYGSGKKTVYTGWLQEEGGTKIRFDRWDILSLKRAVGCNYRRFKESSRGGWLVINETAIDSVAKDKLEKQFTPALDKLFSLLEEVGDTRATPTRRAKLLQYYEELAKDHAKKVLLQHEANKEERAKEREERSKEAKAVKALSTLGIDLKGVDIKDLQELIKTLQK